MSDNPIDPGTQEAAIRICRYATDRLKNMSLDFLDVNEIMAIITRHMPGGELRTALTTYFDWIGPEGESANTAFERIAALFYAEWGFLAPGKDEPAAVNNPLTHQQRADCYDHWLTYQYQERLNELRRALQGEKENNETSKI